MKLLRLILILFLPSIALAQGNDNALMEKVLNRFQFTSNEINVDDQSVRYFIHQKKNSSPNKLVLYLQGTTPNPEPFFSISPNGKGYSYLQYFPSDFELLDDSYLYCVIAPPGISGIGNVGEYDVEKYHRLNSLDYRVFQANAVIDHLAAKHKELSRIIVYGHSEGAPVAAKLGTVNKKITHLGIWGGNTLPDFFDFILMERKANIQGLQSDSLTQVNIDDYISMFKEISLDTLNTTPSNESEIREYTNKRWWSYAEPPLNHLLTIDIPLFVQVATKDENAPIESNYLIPLEFIRLGKTNLTFKVCVDCDHGFVNQETGEDLWSEIFQQFIGWTQK